jgi:hypothetical protein
VSWFPASAAEMPSGVTTFTDTTPESVGAVASIVVGETTVNLDEALVPKSTALADPNPLPEIVTDPPPPADTALGEMAVTAGAPGAGCDGGVVNAIFGITARAARGRGCPSGVVGGGEESSPVPASEPRTCVPDGGVVVRNVLLRSSLWEPAVVPAALGERDPFRAMRAVSAQRQTSNTVCRLWRQRLEERGMAVHRPVSVDERSTDDTSWPISSLIPREARGH